MNSDGRLTRDTSRRSWRSVERFRGTRQCCEPNFKKKKEMTKNMQGERGEVQIGCAANHKAQDTT